MATVAGIKIKTKTTKTRNPLFVDEKYTGTEPEWDTEQALAMTDFEFDHKLRRCFYYYNYFYNQKDVKKHVVEWLKTNKEYTKDQIKAFERSSDKSISMTACSLIMAHRKGMPLKPRHIEFLTSSIQSAINSADPETIEVVAEAKVEVYKPTIQDRLNEKTSEIIGEIEGYYDEVHENKKCDFKAYDFLTRNNVAQSQLGKYVEFFTKRRVELEQAQAKEDPQLVEGYKMYKTADFKRMLTFIDKMLADIEQYRGVKKATKKARVKKAPSKEKVISKMKYCKSDTTLKLVSCNPADIIGASELWVYNTKSRKLGKYVAAAYQTLNVKGTSIINFDEAKSISKTLRKPDEKLKEFAKAGKVQLRKFLEDIKATETRMNGRMTAETVLLKVA
jgi:hypothetical protein